MDRLGVAWNDKDEQARKGAVGTSEFGRVNTWQAWSGESQYVGVRRGMSGHIIATILGVFGLRDNF